MQSENLEPYLIQSKNTLFNIISLRDNQPGQEVNTMNGKESTPANAVLRVTPLRGPVIPNALVRGASGLFVGLKGTAENTKLTWSKEPYYWVIRLTGEQSYTVTPQDGADLYWFDEFNVGVGDHVEVRSGRNVQPPQNEWLFTPLLR